jgi:hypothetical protein
VNKLFLTVIACVVLATPLLADFIESSKSSSTFSGVITAIESERDAFTVQSDENTVKIFAVSPSRKGQLNTGDRVRVTYVDDYQWPLKTLSISGGSSAEK